MDFSRRGRREHWRRLVAALDDPALRDDQFATAESRAELDVELSDTLASIFSGKDAESWEKELGAAGIGCVTVADVSAPEFTSFDPGLRASELTFEVEHPYHGRLVRHGLPVKLSATPGRVAPGCMIGQHTRSLLKENGFTDDEIAGLIADRVVFDKQPASQPPERATAEGQGS